MEVSTISFVVTYVSELPPYLLYNKEILSTHTHTQSTCYTTHECFQTLCCYSPQCAKIEKKMQFGNTYVTFYFQIFFALCSKKPIQETFIFLALRQKQYTRLCFPKFTFLFLCLSSLCSAAAFGGGGSLPDKCVEGHFRKTVKFGS